MDRVKRIWYLSPMRAAKVQASLRIRAVSPELSLLAYTSSESRGTFRQKARSQAPLNGWAYAVKICHDGMLEDTNSLDGAHMLWIFIRIASGKPAIAMPHHSWEWHLVFNALRTIIQKFSPQIFHLWTEISTFGKIQYYRPEICESANRTMQMHGLVCVPTGR